MCKNMTEAEETRETFIFEEVSDSDDIPSSLLSYFETSRSRAAVCEKILLQGPEDFPAHDTEDVLDLPAETDKDVMKLNEQLLYDPENKGNNTFHFLLAPTETEALFTHSVSLSRTYEDEDVQHCEEASTLEVSLNEEQRKKRRHLEEMRKEEEKRQIERDFQDELKKLLEAEKLNQREIELMEKRAQDKLDQELLLQQEMISNLHRRVEEERRRMEEEMRRIKDEEEKRKREEEEIKMEAKRKQIEEETRRKREEEEKKRMEMEEKRREIEEETRRKREKEEKKRMEMEEKRKQIEEEAKRKHVEEETRRKKEEEKKRRMEMEEKRKQIEEETRRKKEEEEKRKQMEEETRKKKEADESKRIELEEKRKQMEVEIRRKKEEEAKRKQVEEETRRKREEEAKRKQIEEEMRMKREEEEKRRMEMEENRKQMEEEAKRRKMEEEEQKMKAEEERIHREEVEERRREEKRKKSKEAEQEMDNETIKMEVERRLKEEEEDMTIGEREKERKQVEEKKEVKEVGKEREKRKVKEEQRSIEVDEKKKEDEIKSKEAERRRWKTEEKDDYGKSKESKNECESKIKDEEEKLEEKEEKNQEERREENGEEMGENIKEEEGKRERVEDKEMVIRLGGSELQEKRQKEDTKSVTGQSEGNRKDKTENFLALEDESTWTSPSLLPDPPGRKSSTSSETTAQPDQNISETSTHQGAVRPPGVSPPTTLPEHTEQKRLCWMKDCVPWSRLSLQNRRKRQRGTARTRSGLRRAAESSSLPPLCPDSLLRSTGWKSLQEVTTVTLQDLPGCSLSTLAQCVKLQSLTLRRCGLKSLESINQLSKLCYVDVQENDISFIDCENMTSLRVLHLGHNNLTSIHGLTGAENLDALNLSYNSIRRIAGLESMKKLQRLSMDHNQLISTRGLKDVYTLLHLDCSHNHLTSVEGLENNALLHTLDLRANSLTTPPGLDSQVLLRELRLDDNSISALHSLAASWLPLLQHLTVAQNRITQLPSMLDFVSLTSLNLRFNCLSELQNLCESLEGSRFLQDVHLTGNPLLQETDWRSSLQKAVPGLRSVDDPETDPCPSPPAGRRVGSASGSFLELCQAQLRQTQELQQQHSRELSYASSSLDALKTSCRLFTEALQLAEEQRFAHEYGDTTVPGKDGAAGRTTPEETPDLESTDAEERPEPTGKTQPTREKSAAESRREATDPETGRIKGRADSGSVPLVSTKGKTPFSNLKMAPASNHRDLDLHNTAAVVIQRRWREYRQQCGNISNRIAAEEGGGGGRGGDGAEPESGPSHVNGRVFGRERAAAVIQASWRGFTLRRRLASALAAVTGPDAAEDDTLEEVDVDGFVFDEASLENHWTWQLPEESPPGRDLVSEHQLSPKYVLPPPLPWRSKQAWVTGEQSPPGSPVNSLRSKSPASPSALCGPPDKSDKIMEEWGFTHSRTALQMLKRAQHMKQHQRKRSDPFARPALFKHCTSKLGQAEACNRPRQRNRGDIKVCEAELEVQQAETTTKTKTERVKQGPTQSAHFLPEISADVLNGGRVQLVANPGYTERRHHASGSWANSSSAARPSNENNYLRRNSSGHARKEASPKSERISFSDNPVRLSGGWGSGKKRDRLLK